MKTVLRRLMGNSQNKALHQKRSVLSRNCPSLSFPLYSVVGWEQSRLRQFHHNCFVESWNYGSCRLSGNNYPHTRFSLGGRSKWSAAMAVTGKFQPHNCFNSSSWFKFQENPNLISLTLFVSTNSLGNKGKRTKGKPVPRLKTIPSCKNWDTFFCVSWQIIKDYNFSSSKTLTTNYSLPSLLLNSNCLFNCCQTMTLALPPLYPSDIFP